MRECCMKLNSPGMFEICSAHRDTKPNRFQAAGQPCKSLLNMNRHLLHDVTSAVSQAFHSSSSKSESGTMKRLWHSLQSCKLVIGCAIKTDNICSTISLQHCAQATAQTVIHKIGVLSVFQVHTSAGAKVSCQNCIVTCCRKGYSIIWCAAAQ